MTRIQNHFDTPVFAPAMNPAQNRQTYSEAMRLREQAMGYAQARPSYTALAGKIQQVLQAQAGLLTSDWGGPMAGAMKGLYWGAMNEGTAPWMDMIVNQLDGAMRSNRLPRPYQNLMSQARNKLGCHCCHHHDSPFHILPYPGPGNDLNAPPSFSELVQNFKGNRQADQRLAWANQAEQLGNFFPGIVDVDPQTMQAARNFSGVADKYKTTRFGQLTNRVQDMLTRGGVHGDGLGFRWDHVNDLTNDIDRLMQPRNRRQVPRDLRRALRSIMPMLEQMKQNGGEWGTDMAKSTLDYQDGF